MNNMSNHPTAMQLDVSYSTISEADLLSKLVPQYRVEKPLLCQFWQRGVNDTYQVHCSDESYSLRVYRHNLRTRDEIDFEIAALNYLSERGCVVASPIAKREGGFVSEIQSPEGLRHAIITKHAKGSTPNYDEAENARLFGISVAELHHLSEGFETKHKRPRLEIEFLLDASLKVVNPFIKKNKENLQFMLDTATNLRQKVEKGKAHDLDVGFCHGDFHGGNVHENDGLLMHFDFDCCGLGFRAYELATFKWATVQREKGDELWSQFLEGYCSARTISEDDLALVDTFVVVRHIWWMALLMGSAGDFGHAVTSERFVNRQIDRIRKLLDKS